MSQSKLTDFHSQEKQIFLEVFQGIPYMDKWIALLVENYIYSWVTKDASFMLKQDKGVIKCVMRYDKKYGKYEEWYTQCDGKKQDILYIQTTYIDDILQGGYKKWHKNGILNIETTYKDGKLHGKYNEWYDKRSVLSKGPQIHKQTTYIDGKLHGKYKNWWENGQLYVEQTFNNGLRYGRLVTYWPNGNRRNTCYFKNDKPASKFAEYNENGNVTFREKINIEVNG